MATRLQAIATYRPRALVRERVDLDAMALRLARGSLFSLPVARMILEELAEELAAALERGDAVTLPGLGRYHVDLHLDGRLRPVHTPDPALRKRLAAQERFRGPLRRPESLGLDAEALVARWNEEHPDDPVA